MQSSKLLIFSSALLSTFSLKSQTIIELCSATSGNGTVVEMQHFGDSLYSTGFFTNLCGHNHDYVAHWDGNEWSSSSISLGAPGHSITSIGDTLYFGSYVETTDSNWVFFWDGSQIDTLGNGVYLTTASGFSELANIYDIIEFHGEIIACGEFDRVGANSISGIMRWNGQNWEGLSSGLSGSCLLYTSPSPRDA